MAALTVAAVAYDPKVVTIWQGLRKHLREEAGLDAEVVLFLHYRAQVEALLAGRVDVAWNTNLAHVQSEAWSEGAVRALCMRDTDAGWTTRLLALAGGPVRRVEDLRGRTLALGSRDSGHAALLPVHDLARIGLRAEDDYRVVRFDTDVGTHGDTGRSELDVLAAVLDGRAEVGAVGSPFWAAVQSQGLAPRGALVEVWSSPEYTHCVFTARPGLDPALAEAFERGLYAMRFDDPRHRPILEAEGLRAWVPYKDGHAGLREAARAQGALRR